MKKNKYLKFLRQNALVVLITISLVIGFILGIILTNIQWDDSTHNSSEIRLWFALPGYLFIRSLELFSIPVVFFGVVTTASSMTLRSQMRMTLIGLGFVVGKHLLGTLTGLIGSFVILTLNSNSTSTSISKTNLLVDKQKNAYDILTDILRNLLPSNIMRSAVNQELTVYLPITNENNTVVDFARKIQYVDSPNILGILVFGK